MKIEQRIIGAYIEKYFGNDPKAVKRLTKIKKKNIGKSKLDFGNSIKIKVKQTLDCDLYSNPGGSIDLCIYTENNITYIKLIATWNNREKCRATYIYEYKKEQMSYDDLDNILYWIDETSEINEELVETDLTLEEKEHEETKRTTKLFIESLVKEGYRCSWSVNELRLRGGTGDDIYSLVFDGATVTINCYNYSKNTSKLINPKETITYNIYGPLFEELMRWYNHDYA